MENIIPQATAISIQEAAFSGDHKRLKSQLQMMLTQSVSFFDTAAAGDTDWTESRKKL